MTHDRYALARFRAAVKILDAQRRILIDSRAEADLTEAMSAIIRHLHGLSDSAVHKIVSGPRHKESLALRKNKEASAASSLSLDDVEALLSDPTTTRLKLEAIAVGRFEVPKGSLRSLGTVDQLREKIITLANNERAHQTISSVAKDAGNR